MNHIDLDAQDEAVKRFVLSLPRDPAGSVLEVGGKPVVRIVPIPVADEVADWTPARDARRCELIDREIAATITAAEAAELRSLQAAMLRHRRAVAPLPLDEARRLHRDLLDKAAGGPDA